jgi:hypothetical protein
MTRQLSGNIFLVCHLNAAVTSDEGYAWQPVLYSRKQIISGARAGLLKQPGRTADW